jgi:hypothetical protein
MSPLSGRKQPAGYMCIDEWHRVLRRDIRETEHRPARKTLVNMIRIVLKIRLWTRMALLGPYFLHFDPFLKNFTFELLGKYSRFWT